MGLTDEAKLLSATALDDFIDEFMEETIDVLRLIPEILHVLIDALSPDWDVPGVFDDDMAIPPGTGTNPNKWFHDYPLIKFENQAIVYDYTSYFENSQTSIDGAAIGRNTFMFIVCVLGVFFFARTGARKASVVFALIMNKFFGINARISQVEDKVDTLLEYAETVDDYVPTESNEGLEEAMLNQFEVLKIMLQNADEEMSSLIQALRTDRQRDLKSIEWTEGVTDVLPPDDS